MKGWHLTQLGMGSESGLDKKASMPAPLVVVHVEEVVQKYSVDNNRAEREMRGCPETQYSCTMMAPSFAFEAPSGLKALARTNFQGPHMPCAPSLVDDATAKVPSQPTSVAIRCILLGTGNKRFSYLLKLR